MTLRVRLEIVPFGDESRVREIGRLEISNIGPNGLGFYTYEVKEHKPNPGDWEFREGSTYEIITHKQVVHQRSDGAWKLVEKVLNSFETK